VRPPFHDEVELVGCALGGSRFPLVGLEAEEVADEARPVEDADAHRPGAEKAPQAAEVDDFHRSF